MFYTLYKITNLLNGKIYIGCHTTDNLDDEYYGSGNLIRFAIKKYGIENFKKEYLDVFESAEEMYNAESKIVNEEFVNRNDTYNIRQGGFGGWEPATKKAAWLCKNDSNYLNKKRKDSSKVMTENHRQGKIRHDTFTGRTHTDETKRKIGAKVSKAQQGKNNSQYGTMWICNIELKENKKIPKDSDIPDGWVKGKNKWNSINKPKPLSPNELSKLRSKNAKKYGEIRRVIKEKEYRKIYNRFILDFEKYGMKSFSKFAKENHHVYNVSYGTMYKIKKLFDK